MPLPISLCVVLSSAAIAADGVREINQTCAVNIGCFSGDVAGFPVTITQSGSYVLTSNLAPTGTSNGVEVASGVSNVTVDLGGFGVTGPVVCTRGSTTTTCVGGPAGTGVTTTVNNADITFRNGSVRGMGSGVRMSNASNARVERIQATSNSGDGIFGGFTAIVDGCIANLNGADGIGVGDSSTVRNSIAKNNQQSGIQASSGCLLVGNTTNTNSEGILATGGSNLIGNTASDNVSFGFLLNSLAGYTNSVLTSNNGNAFASQTNPEVSGGTAMSPNLCGIDTICP